MNLMMNLMMNMNLTNNLLNTSNKLLLQLYIYFLMAPTTVATGASAGINVAATGRTL
jgi:hypothetical protein